MKIHDHDAASARSQSVLIWTAAVTALTFFVELAGGWWTNSVALLSDAGHVFMDLLALLFSFFALRLADRSISDRRTFGLHRLEVFAAFLNGALVAALAVWIVLESLGRLRAPPEVKSGPMLALSVFGLAMNMLVAWKLHDFAAKDVNVRSAFLHVASDTLASLGVVVGGVLIHWTGLLVIDPVVGMFVAVIVVFNAVRLLKDSIEILLEGVPKDVDLNEVVQNMKSVAGVRDVEDTHIWNICSHISSLSAHVTLPAGKEGEQQKVLEALNRLLKERFNIEHVTIQIHFTDWKPVEKNIPGPQRAS